MIACLQSPRRDDERPATYAMRLDRHISALLAPLGPPDTQVALVALAYWGLDNVIESPELAGQLRQALDELAELPHGTLAKLLTRSMPPLDQGLHDTASWVLGWLTEYLYLDEQR